MSSAILDIGYAENVMQFTLPSVNQNLPSEAVQIYESEEPVLIGSVPDPTIGTLADVPGALAGHFLYDFYYRIWVIPTTLLAQNPQYDTPIPFHVWNAYPQPATNSIVTIDEVDADGLVLGGNTPADFRALEYRQMTVVITTDAATEVDAHYTFNFSNGAGSLRFVAAIASVLRLTFQEGIQVDLNWLTDVLERYNGSEQRLALRERPRKTIGASIVLTDDQDRKFLYDEIYKTSTTLIVVPQYQHQTPLRATTVLGDNKIYCNPKRADLRVGGYVLMLKRNGDRVLAKVSALFSDHVTIEAPHSQIVPMAGTKVMSAVTTRMPDNSGFSMQSKAGNASLRFTEYEAEDTLLHPLASVSFDTHYGTVVLTKRPSNDEADEMFSTGQTEIDNETGRPARFSAWDQKYVTGERKYLINTMIDQDALDYWFAFLDYCRGQQKPFLASTWREDLVAVEDGFTLNTIEVEGLEYAQLYFGTDTYMNLEIETSIGTFWVQVLDADPNLNTTTITFRDTIVTDIEGNPVGDPALAEVTRISYLISNRLGSDKVSLMFMNTYATISLSLKAI